MKGIPYYSHDCNAQHDPKIIKLMYRYGWSAYGIYHSILEDLCKESPTHKMLKDYGCIAMAKRVKEELIESIIEDFGLFKVDKKYFYSERMIENMEFAKAKSDKARQSALVRWSKEKEPNAKAMQPHSARNATKLNKSKVKEIKVNISFEKVWDLYDYKTGTKDKLKKKWESLTDIERENIFKDIPLYKAETPEKKFRKHFSTYLNQRGWEDERRLNSNGVADFEYDGAGKFRKGYCDKCNEYASYRDEELFGESRCCNAKILKRKKPSAVR